MVLATTKIKSAFRKNLIKINLQEAGSTNLKLSRFIYINLFVLISLIVLGLIAGLISLEQGQQLEYKRILFRFVELFNMNLEANVPSWYSAFLMIIISGLSFFISKIKTPQEKKYFLGLSIIFLLMSVDEISSIHEILNNPVRNLLDLGNIFYWAWVVPGLILSIIIALSSRQFLMMIDKRFRKLFLLSGAVYISGALGFEMLGGWLFSNKLGNSYYYVIEVVIEESFEMVGLLLFIYTLIEYLKSFIDEVRIGIQ